MVAFSRTSDLGLDTERIVIGSAEDREHSHEFQRGDTQKRQPERAKVQPRVGAAPRIRREVGVPRRDHVRGDANG